MAQATAASSSASSLASRYSAQALEDKAQELVALYSDLEAVQATLTSLPQSLKHRVTVPVGKQRQAPRGGNSMKEDANGFVELRETLEEAEALSREAVPSTSSAPRALTEEERAKSRAIWDQFAKLEEENDPEAIAAAEAALDAQEQRERAEAEMSMDEFYANFLNQGRGAPQEAPMAASGRSSKSEAADEMARKAAAVPGSGGVVGSSAFSGHVMERESGSLEPPRAPASSTASGSAPSAESAAKPKRVSLFKKNLAAGKST
ncbi:Hypothetical Protein FCC1311_032102 [Hondaea fermentalgiana]|uniref:Uncharacterized protein n=1 Tax=Hondaea fermentalgiana TaxID=2315210 RepID=A0A2R5G7G6_9STRA|nr:Hypothetical Protein FCC1311_032102 [Hondaea fermentalgiana]|eukprot:GBG26987.1 Hypothetical Protein FCC1311_032102 [Hondaea fermentalgiana]